ncbi:MAG: GNAT family N-acetyltransferase [Chloroflexi bacterium]|nr:GNAT family N-acetyltransferase [Chloroflexota bacterium]
MNILTNSSTEALLDATEINYAEFFALYTHVPHIQHHDEPGVLRLSSSQPVDYLNTVLRTTLENGTASSRIREIIAGYKTQRVSVRWHVWPNSQPANLTTILDQYGLHCTRNIPCMALDLATMPPPDHLIDHLEMAQVDDLAALYEWMSPVAYDLFFCLAYEMGLRSTAPVLHFLARYKGEPAATASIYFGAGVAGLYDVVTMPEVRGRGIGGAVCTMALQVARQMGYRYAVLQSSKMGYRVYQRLGFTEIGRLLHYNWYDFYGDFSG